MKRFLSGAVMVGMAMAVNAQNCSDLIISEYVEGTGNNKALEFYNASPNPINVANYRVIRWDNGYDPVLPPNDISTIDPSKLTTFPDNVTLAPYQTYVIGFNRQGDPDPSLNTNALLVAKLDTFFTTDCDPAVIPPQPRTLCFNGDDALELQKNVGGVWQTVDIFGLPGEQPLNSAGTASPTAGWTSLSPYFAIPAGYNSGTQGPYFKQYWTQDGAMIRKPSVLKGITTYPAAGQIGPPVVPSGFNPAAEWDSIPVNIFDSLGVHRCECEFSTGIDDETSKLTNYTIYPNPAREVIYVSATLEMEMIRVVSLAGQTVFTVAANNKNGVSVNVGSLTRGIYFVETNFKNGLTQTKKIIIE